MTKLVLKPTLLDWSAFGGEQDGGLVGDDVAEPKAVCSDFLTCSILGPGLTL